MFHVMWLSIMAPVGVRAMSIPSPNAYGHLVRSTTIAMCEGILLDASERVLTQAQHDIFTSSTFCVSIRIGAFPTVTAIGLCKLNRYGGANT